MFHSDLKIRKPVFSIIVATYGRGRHIAPTIESVLQQRLSDFELIVVGDGCDDETESVVRSFPDPRIVWHNLPHNNGSQSFANNRGIETARGEWIAYLGHDDIWMPDHLAAIHGAIKSHPNSDFVVSGCVYHTPPGVGIYHIHGMFDAPDAATKHFFPPSSVAHRLSIVEKIGPWRDPRTVVSPVDWDFMARAANAGANFVSTGKITVHKFAAGHRYLSYLQVTSDEQSEMLAAIRAGSAPDEAAMIASARRGGTFMLAMPTKLEKSYKPGDLFRINRVNKGLARPQLSPLSGRTVIEQTGESRALDWHPIEQRGNRKFRWSGPNPRPKILIPYTGERARVTLETLNSNLDGLALYVGYEEIDVAIRRDPAGTLNAEAQIPLKADGHTVLTLDMPTAPLSKLKGGRDHRPVGIALGDIIIEPADPHGLRQLFSQALARRA